VIFAGAALATLLALMGVTYDKWSPRLPTETQPVAEQAAAPPAGQPAESEPIDEPPTELASVIPEQGAAGRSMQETPLAKPEAAAPAPDAATAQPEAPADDSKPSFDTVRIESDGSAVIAGRSLPESHVTVMLDGEPLGSAKSDTGGAWVFIPEEPVPPGDHQLTLRMLAEGAAAIYSDQSVALQVPERAMGEPLVVLSDQGQPSRVIQKPEKAAQAQSEEPAAGEQDVAAAASSENQKQNTRRTGSMSLTLSTVDYNDAGDIIFSGTAKSASSIRLYVDNAPVGDAAVSSDGKWTFAGSEQIRPGTHTLRVDQLHADGKVAERIELPFVRAKPQQVAALNESVQPKTEPAEDAAHATGAAEETSPAAPPQNEMLVEEQPAAAAAQPAGEPALEPSPAPAAQAQADATAEAPAAADEPPSPEPSAMEESQGTDMAAAEASPAEGSTAQQPSTAAPAAPAIEMPRKGQIVIQPGNSLWRISRVIYGRGIEYTVIYDANRTQIRDPNLIYPGQIFATPGAEPPAMIDPANQTPLATTTSTPTSAE